MPRDCTLKSEKGWGCFSSNLWCFGRPEKKIRFIENALGLQGDPGTGVEGHVQVGVGGVPPLAQTSIPLPLNPTFPASLFSSR